MKIKKLFLDREVRKINMEASNREVEQTIENDLEMRLGLKLPVRITVLDEKTVNIRYYFKPKDNGPRTIGDRSLPEEYITILLNGEWEDYVAPNTVGWAPRFGGYFRIMIEPEEISRIMKRNNREMKGSRIKSVEPIELSDGFEVKIVFG